MTTTKKKTSIEVEGDNVLDVCKEIIMNILANVSNENQELFYARLAAWAQGMTTPQCYEGATRTESIRAFFRGFKRKR